MKSSDLRAIRERLAEYDFADVFGFTWGINIVGDARAAVDASCDRFLVAITGQGCAEEGTADARCKGDVHRLCSALADRTDPVSKQPDRRRGRFQWVADEVVPKFRSGDVVYGYDKAPDAEVVVNVCPLGDCDA